MKILRLILRGLFSSSSFAEQQASKTEIQKRASTCFGTILSKPREIYFGICLETETKAFVMEHSNKSRGRKSPYGCWSEVA